MSYVLVENNFHTPDIVDAGALQDAMAAIYATRTHKKPVSERDTMVKSHAAVETEGAPSLDLPTPLQSLMQSEKVLGTDEFSSIVSIIGAILLAQGKSNSEFWKILFANGTITMNAAVELAPLIAQAIITSFNEQANITDNEAKIAFYQGIGAATTGASTIGMGAFSAVKESKGLSDTPETEKIGANAGRDVPSTTGAGSALDDDNTQTGVGNQIKKAVSGAKGAGMSKMQLAYKIYMNAQNAAQMANLGNQLIQGFTTWHYKNNIAEHQRNAGQADAQSKMYEQFVTWYVNAFQRSEELRQGSQNNIDLAMKIFDALSSMVSQTTQSMFRG